MKLGSLRLRCLVLGLAVLVSLWCVSPARAQDDSDESSTAVNWEEKEKEEAKHAEVIAKAANSMIETFLLQSVEQFKSPDWIVRSMGVIGLAQVDDSRISDKLIEVLMTDTNPLVRAYACEALNTRRNYMNEDQKKRWREGAIDLAKKNGLRGDLRVGLVRALMADGPNPDNLLLFSKLFVGTNSLDTADVHTLWAMRDLVGQWKSPELIRALIAALGTIDDAYRAEFLLTGLVSDVPPARSMIDKGSKVMWEETQKNWTTWIDSANLGTVEPGSPWWKADNALMPDPVKIENPADPKWRKDLELKPLRLGQLDVVFAIDSTASMTPVITWIKRDAIKLMRAFGLISREPRIGVILYRDYGDEYIIRPYALTGNGEALAKAISDAKARGGGDLPEAVYEALQTAVGLGWVSNKKIVIVVGDAPPHQKAMENCTKLVEKSAAQGFYFHFIKARTQWGDGTLSEFDNLAALGKGSATWINFAGDPDPNTPSRYLLSRMAYADENKTPDRHVLREVLRSVLNEPYHDRLDPFVNVLLEYVSPSVPEKRQHFEPKPPDPRPSDIPGRRPDPPPPPVDPQFTR